MDSQQILQQMTAQLVTEMQSKVKDLFPKETGTLELLNKENKKLRQQIAEAEAEGRAEAEAEIKAKAEAEAKERLKKRAKAEAYARMERQIKAEVDAAKTEYFRLSRKLETAKAEAKAKVLAKGIASPKTEAKAVAKTEAKTEAVAKAVAKTEAKTKAKAVAKTEAKTKAKAVAKTEAKTKAVAKAAIQRPTRAEELAQQDKKVVATSGNPKKPAEIVVASEERKVGAQKTVTILLEDGTQKTFGSQSQFRNWKLTNKAVSYQLVAKEVVAK